MNNHQLELKVGQDSVVLGRVTGEIGDRSVVIGPTDDRGNVRLNQSMAVGRGALAGPGSIAIGAGAGAGSNELLTLLVELRRAVQAIGDEASLAKVDELNSALEGANGQPNYRQAIGILESLRAATTLEAVWSLIDRIREVVGQWT